jgi:hypothetical protein
MEARYAIEQVRKVYWATLDFNVAYNITSFDSILLLINIVTYSIGTIYPWPYCTARIRWLVTLTLCNIYFLKKQVNNIADMTDVVELQ